jgi:hypothetical protein
MAFFSKTNVMIKILHNLALFRVKNANFFAEFFGEKKKNHNIGPRLTAIHNLQGKVFDKFCQCREQGDQIWKVPPSWVVVYFTMADFWKLQKQRKFLGHFFPWHKLCFTTTKWFGL